MRICVKLKPLAILQKIFGWLIVIEAAKSGMEPVAVLGICQAASEVD